LKSARGSASLQLHRNNSDKSPTSGGAFSSAPSLSILLGLVPRCVHVKALNAVIKSQELHAEQYQKSQPADDNYHAQILPTDRLDFLNAIAVDDRISAKQSISALNFSGGLASSGTTIHRPIAAFRPSQTAPMKHVKAQVMIPFSKKP
jgi:hypothetical protein